MARSYLRDKAVAKRYNVSRSTLWRWAHEPRFADLNFPKPYKIGPNTSVWDEAELDAWDAERKAQTNTAA